MKLQKASLCGLYAALELASDPKQQRSAAEIAAKYGISPDHLAKVLRTLGRARLVEASRGVGGGYKFSGNAKRVTLLDIIEMFEEIGPGDAEDSPATPIGSALHSVLREIDEIARATLGSITLETLLKQMRRSAKGHGKDDQRLARAVAG